MFGFIAELARIAALYIFSWRDVGILDFGIQGGRYIHRVILCDVIVTHHSSVGGSDLEAHVDVRRGYVWLYLRCNTVVLYYTKQ